MAKRYFDAVVIVPLEEEFDAALTPASFTFVEDLSTERQIRFSVSVPNSDLSVLLVKQNAMGKTETQNAVWMCLSHYDAGMLICLGIAGGLSNDVRIGDVCFTGSVIDLLDNTKTSDAPESKSDVAFSPTYYESPLETSVAFNLDRILPDSKPGHEAWRAEREIYALSQIENEFTGRNGKSEKIQKPNVHEGQIACGSVSGSEDYNKKIKNLNRKVLAIDTESGGLFAIAKINRLPALSVRGISDYAGAGLDKSLFEIQTNNKARLVAASNAAAFLVRQLGRRQVRSFFVTQRDKFRGKIETISEAATDALAKTLVAEGERYEAKLRDLAPSYPLQTKGYRIPVPRVRLSDNRVGPDSARTDPIEIRDAIRNSRVIILQIPPQYPDLSLAWIVGRDLLLA